MSQIKMVHVAADAATGALSAIAHDTTPDHSAGDLAYFDASRPHAVQIRPLLGHEHPKDAIDPYPPGAMWVVWKSRSGFQLRSIVSLPAPYRKNIRSNVTRAIRKIEKFSAAHGKLFVLAHSGVDPFGDERG